MYFFPKLQSIKYGTVLYIKSQSNSRKKNNNYIVKQKDASSKVFFLEKLQKISTMYYKKALHYKNEK